MNQEEKILTGGGTAFEQSLLSSVKGEAPSQALSAQMMGPIIGPPLPVVDPGSSLATSASAKWVLMTAAALGVGGAFFLGSAHSDSQKQTDQADEKLSQSTHITVEDSDVHHATPPSNQDNVTPASAPHATPLGRTNVERPSGSVSGKQKADNQLADEMRLLDQARAALAQQNPSKALQLLSSYDARYPRGTLRQEATVLRVSALKATGQSDRAEQLTDKFLKESPNSAHKSRLQAEDAQEKAH